MIERSEKGAHTLREIRSQADSWEAVFREIDRKKDRLFDLVSGADEIVCAGCGSAFNASHSVAPFFQRVSGKSCRAVHSSDLATNPDLFLRKKGKTVAIVFSRSGDTTESVLALRKAKSLGCGAISVVCFGTSAMAREADAAVILEDAAEKSVVTTRSLTSMVLAGYYLAAASGDDKGSCAGLRKLPGIGRANIARFEELGRSVGANVDIRKYAFLGSGTCYGLAREAQLKIKEMVLLPSDSYVSLDFQHGPMSNVDGGMLVTLFVTDAGRAFERELVENMKSLGGRLFVICDRDGGDFSGKADHLLELGTGLGDGVRDILAMPALQFMAYRRSLSVGCDPDNPRNLSYYVTVKGTGNFAANGA